MRTGGSSGFSYVTVGRAIPGLLIGELATGPLSLEQLDRTATASTQVAIAAFWKRLRKMDFMVASLVPRDGMPRRFFRGNGDDGRITWTRNPGCLPGFHSHHRCGATHEVGRSIRAGSRPVDPLTRGKRKQRATARAQPRDPVERDP